MLKKLFHYFKTFFTKTPVKNQYSITISLKPDYDIDIKFAYPDLNTCDDYNIPNIAERYAQLLVYINSVALKYKLQDYIEEQTKENDNVKHKLFFDNIVFFHDVMLQEIRAKKHKNEPLIRPSSVFNIKS